MNARRYRLYIGIRGTRTPVAELERGVKPHPPDGKWEPRGWSFTAIGPTLDLAALSGCGCAKAEAPQRQFLVRPSGSMLMTTGVTWTAADLLVLAERSYGRAIR